LALDPGFIFAQARLAQLYGLKGIREQTVAHMIASAVLSGKTELAEKMEFAHSRGGFKAAIRVQVKADELSRKQGKWVSLTDDAWYILLMGDEDRALSSLDEAVQQRDPFVTALAVDPRYDRMRSDPRFVNILKRVGLPH
jgi:hypothetical protein